MNLEWLGPLREGGEVRIALVGAVPRAGIVWRVAEGAGVLTPLSDRVDEGKIACARYTAAESAGATVRIEADVYA